jgi:hypothetical protein
MRTEFFMTQEAVVRLTLEYLKYYKRGLCTFDEAIILIDFELAQEA